MSNLTKTPLCRAVQAAKCFTGPRKGRRRIADACGVSYQYIERLQHDWQRTGQAPANLLHYAHLIERAVHGVVKADELYPSVQWLRDESGQITGYQVSVPQSGTDSARAA